MGIDGDLWVDIDRQKTSTRSNVPLLPPALAIIEKYADHPEAEQKGSLLPVISNQKMNAYLKEIAFLAEVKKIKPEVPRIILTGYADKENAIKAINDVGLYQYIEKPWSNDDLLIILRNGLEKQRLMKKLQEKIDQINQAYGELEGLHGKQHGALSRSRGASRDRGGPAPVASRHGR